MRRVILGTLLLSGCAETAAVPDDAAAQAGQERVCAEAVAGHVGMAPAEMSPEWRAAGPDGVDVVVVRHADTFHTCEVDREPRVQALRHPDAE